MIQLTQTATAQDLPGAARMVAQDIDAWASRFVTNKSVLVVPVAGLRADSILTASTPHGTVKLCDKIGYMRMQAVKGVVEMWRGCDLGWRAHQHLRRFTDVRAMRTAFRMIRASPRASVSFAVDDCVVEFDVSQPPFQLMCCPPLEGA